MSPRSLDKGKQHASCNVASSIIRRQTALCASLESRDHDSAVIYCLTPDIKDL